ncbi:MAG: SDR family oxidoreductase [Planctomycetes bacterium]|nr:SDR family oxidoreductase [Planctomycetota bacterium]
MERFAGKVCFVTGGGSGIGRAICRRLADEGAVVAVADLNLPGAEETARQLPPGRGQAVRCDVGDLLAARAALAEVKRASGPVTVLVNNAGFDRMARFLDTDPALWEALIRVNFVGVLNCCYAALPDMIAAGGGRIVNIASDAARVGSSGEAVYAGTKGAVAAFTKALAREHARDRVLVNAVCPGPTDTPLLRDGVAAREGGEKVVQAFIASTPLRRLAQPEEVAAAVAFFASADGDFCTGQLLSVSGGLTMA